MRPSFTLASVNGLSAGMIGCGKCFGTFKVNGADITSGPSLGVHDIRLNRITRPRKYNVRITNKLLM
jgi:hypothetical protein